jgi:hypothetical protein
MSVTIPAVEVAHYADAISMRRPNCKRDTLCPAYFGYMRAELFVDLLVPPFAEEMQIDFTEVRVGHLQLSRGLTQMNADQRLSAFICG